MVIIHAYSKYIYMLVLSSEAGALKFPLGNIPLPNTCAVVIGLILIKALQHSAYSISISIHVTQYVLIWEQWASHAQVGSPSCIEMVCRPLHLFQGGQRIFKIRFSSDNRHTVLYWHSLWVHPPTSSQAIHAQARWRLPQYSA
jgi:hypothetical protein